MTTNDKKLYENGCACVRWNSAERRYEVHVSCDGGDMQLDSSYTFTGNGANEDENLTKAKARCDVLSTGKPKEIEGYEVVYENGCAAVCRVTYKQVPSFSDDYRVYVLSTKANEYIKDETFNEGSDDARLEEAKRRCDNLAGRNGKRNIDEQDYPELHEKSFFYCGWATILGLAAFLLFWVGIVIKSGIFSSTGDDDCFLLYPFTSAGFDFFSVHWWQTILLILLSGLLGVFFWGLSRIRRFSPLYRMFVKAFGKTQTVLTAAVSGVVALYWAIIGLWRAIISPIPDALGYPHFIAATIYFAVIVWGIVDFMKYRKQPAWSAA